MTKMKLEYPLFTFRIKELLGKSLDLENKIAETLNFFNGGLSRVIHDFTHDLDYTKNAKIICWLPRDQITEDKLAEVINSLKLVAEERELEFFDFVCTDEVHL